MRILLSSKNNQLMAVESDTIIALNIVHVEDCEECIIKFPQPVVLLICKDTDYYYVIFETQEEVNNAISKAFREGLLDLSDKADTTFFNPNYEDEDDLKNILKKHLMEAI